jgi:ATP-dependent helicase/nuclease subunit A
VSDGPARERARTGFDCPLVVEAGAGTGKTTTLIARVTTWCVGLGWENAARVLRADPGAPDAADRIAARTLDGVVAITFTEAAAAEMAGRFGAALVELAAGRAVIGVPDLPCTDEQARLRARALLGAVDRLVVSTIHAFCARVLASAPSEAGLHPAHRVDADGVLLEEVVHEVVVDWFTEVFGAESGERQGPLVSSAKSLVLLAERGVGSEEVVKSLTDLAREAVPASALAVPVFTKEAVSALIQRVREKIRAWRDPVAEALRGSPLAAERLRATLESVTELARVLRTPAANPVEGRPPEVAVVMRLWRVVGDFDTAYLKEMANGRINKTEHALFGASTDAVVRASDELLRAVEHLADLDVALLDAAREVLEPLLARVHAELRRRGVVTFQHLLRGARELLRSDARLRARFRDGLDQLLVDEFQDTDAIQCDLVRMLALEGDKRPGLFLVGDPKQSIYGWRSADLVAYQDFVDEVRTHGGEVLLLNVNRRSLEPILREVERCVDPVMSFEQGYQAKFQPLVAHRVGERPPDEPWAPVEHWVTSRFDGKAYVKLDAGAQAELEATAIAADLLRLHAKGLDWDKVALLMRSATDLDKYVSALRDAGIPYTVERNLQYFKRREIIEAAALVRCIFEPEDTLALLTLLRSPLVGAPDAALLPLWRGQLPAKMAALYEPDEDMLAEIAAIGAAAAQEAAGTGATGVERVAGWEYLLVQTAREIAWLRAAADTLPVDRFVSELRERLPMEMCAATRHLGAFRLANLQRFYTELLDALSKGDPLAHVRALRAGVSGGRDAEEARPTDGGERAVRIMTIHKSKGLDFEHVYLLQMHKGRRSGQHSGRTENAFKDFQGAWEYQIFGACTPGWDRVTAHEARVDGNERVRLLYVAMTRAKNRLVLLGAWHGVEAKPIERAANLLELVAARADRPDIDEVGRQRRIDHGGARWLLADVDRGEAVRAKELRAIGPIDPDAELARRAWAAQRMARPTSRAASADAHEDGVVAVETEEGTLTFPGAPLGGAGATEPGAAAGGAAAAVVGTAVHRALELLDLGAPQDRALAGACAAADEVIQAALFGEERVRATARAHTLLAGFVGGTLGARMRALKKHIVARELRMFAAGEDGLAPDTRPVGYVEGAIDMVYRDPADGQLVVVDYKTDGVRTDAERDARAAMYARQTVVYVTVLQSALALATPPRAELWFLSRDEVVVV